MRPETVGVVAALAVLGGLAVFAWAACTAAGRADRAWGDADPNAVEPEGDAW